MNKALKYTIIISAILIIGMIGLYFYLIQTDERVENLGDITDVYIFGRPTIPQDTEVIDTTTGDVLDYISIEDKTETKPASFRKISSEPVSGFFAGDGFVRYTDRVTGHIFEVSTLSTTQKRISNTTIPKIYEAIWLDEDSSIIRYLDDNHNIKSFYIDSVESEEIEGVFLQDNMKEIIKAGESIFYLLTDNTGSRGIVSDYNGDNKTQIFESPLTEWLIQRPQEGTITFTTKPAYGVGGFMYFFDTTTGVMTKILDNINGLTTLTSSDKTKVLFSETSRNIFGLNIYNIKDDVVENLAVQTFPEKCVWSENSFVIYCGAPSSVQSGEYPDEWYQGIVSFSDIILKIDLEQEIIDIIISPEEPIDIIKPALSPKEDYLYFINKKDLSLWGLELK